MRYLLDTHAFIWLMEASNKLSPKVRTILQDKNQIIFVSVASVWEIIIKKAKGKLKTPEDIEGGINYAGFSILPIEISHALEFSKLPAYHNDPFDRMLISQAKVEKMKLITSDPKIWQYQVPVMKA